MLIASLIALAEKDIKKIIALSTLSQLGFIITSLGLNFLNIAFFHLITHAYFKSCMFVQVGGIILLNDTSQEGRSYSRRNNRIILTSLGISCLSLCGFPLLRGFISKDLILIGVISPSLSIIIFSAYALGVFFTLLYRLRIMLYSLSNYFSPNSKMALPYSYSSSTIILVILGVSSGWFIFSNSILPPLSVLFLEKLIPLLFWLLVLLLPYSYFSLIENIGRMLIQDTIVLYFQKLPLYNFKILDSAHLYSISSINYFLSRVDIFLR